MLTWSERCVHPACVRVWERACVSLTRGTVMNRGCVFASRDLARCGTLQKCGQAVAAAAAAETACQEPAPRPQLPGDAAEPLEKVCKLPAGAARTPGHLAGGQAGVRGLGWLPGAEPAVATSPAGLPAAAGGRAHPGRDIALAGHLAFAPGTEGLRVARHSSRSLLQPPPASVRCSLASLPLPRRCPK